jgi:hypothetical protein
MRTYRAYFLDDGAHILRPPEIIECANDHDASRQAKKLVNGCDVELWEDARLVGRFTHK